jgi:hypothetical protein
MEFFANRAEIEITLWDIGEFISTESTERIGRRSPSQKWSHISRNALQHGCFASIASVCHQLPGRSAQCPAVLVKKLADRLAI